MLHLAMLCLLSARAEPDVPAPAPPTEAPAQEPSVGVPATDDPTGGPPVDAPAEPAPAPSDLPEIRAAATDPEPAGSTFDVVLGEAKQRYFQGEPDSAKELLRGLQLRLYAGEQADWPSVVEALTYLGEIYYVAGDQASAEVAFRYLLERDPDTPISPYHHSIEVVNLFELVRTMVRASRASTAPVTMPAGPVPLWTFAPFGTPQILQNRTAAGVLYGVLQLGLGAASIGLYAHLDHVNQVRGPTHPLWPLEDVTENVENRRYLLQWPTTLGFYAVWGV
ncbi:MAG: tetratricopeptide repeat protein, partial [Myxococcota bacterium]